MATSERAIFELTAVFTEKVNLANSVQVVAIEVERARICLRMKGSPWWLGGFGGAEIQYRLVFDGVSESSIDCGEIYSLCESDFLDLFEVSRLADQAWADTGTTYSVYGSQPLPLPMQLYTIVADFLKAPRAPRTADDFLNAPSIMQFCSLTNSNAYLVSQAPERLHQLVCSEMEKQKVRYSVLAHQRSVPDGYFVRFGRSTLICNSVILEVGE